MLIADVPSWSGRAGDGVFWCFTKPPVLSCVVGTFSRNVVLIGRRVWSEPKLPTVAMVITLCRFNHAFDCPSVSLQTGGKMKSGPFQFPSFEKSYFSICHYRLVQAVPIQYHSRLTMSLIAGATYNIRNVFSGTVIDLSPKTGKSA